MKHSTTLLLALVAALGVTATAAGKQTIQQRLASEYARAAVMRVAGEPLTVDALAIGVNMISEALALDPTNVEFWQTALNIALMAENEQLKTTALERLTTLDPTHETARLMRLNASLDRFQTFEERSAAYERLLTDENVPRLGEPVASRLALDLALLHQRRGEIEAFSHWLTKAVTWDRANRSAAAIATGFYRSQLDDPVAVAELLVNLMITDPTNVSAQVDLAQLLLEHGAFEGAERIYRLAIRSMLKDYQSPPNGVIVDHAVSLWARGHDEHAIEVLARREREIEFDYRLFMQRQNSKLTVDELMAMHRYDQSIATVMAVILVNRGDPQAANAVNIAMSACASAIEDLKTEAAGVPPENTERLEQLRAALAQRHLEAAWTALWLGGPLEKVQQWLDAAADYQPLSPDASARFAGWLAFRKGDLDGATQLLAPLAPSDPTARLGLGHIFQAQERTSEASREFLDVARTQPGSVIGVWAAARLKELVGQTVTPSDQAQALNQLIASINVHFDRAVEDPSLAIGMRVTFPKDTFSLYEPLVATVQLTNNSMYPLGFDRNGPIRPQILVVPSVRSAHVERSGELRTFMIDAGRVLRLKPKESVTIQLDLRNYWPGEAINSLAVNGALLKLRTFLNFAVNPQGAAVPALYGMEVEAPLTRIDGQRLTTEWRDETIGMLRTMSGGDELLRRMAIFSHLIAAAPRIEATLEDRQFIESARIAFGESFAKLDGASQAWILSVMPRGSPKIIEGLQPTLAIARSSQDRLVSIAYLVFHAQSWQDPMFDAAKRSDDAKLQALARAIEADMRLKEAAANR